MGERWGNSGAGILSHLEILSSLTAERRNDDPLSERQARPKDATGTDRVPGRRFAFRDARFPPRRSLPRLVQSRRICLLAPRRSKTRSRGFGGNHSPRRGAGRGPAGSCLSPFHSDSPGSCLSPFHSLSSCSCLSPSTPSLPAPGSGVSCGGGPCVDRGGQASAERGLGSRSALPRSAQASQSSRPDAAHGSSGPLSERRT